MSENQGNGLEAAGPSMEQLFPQGFPPNFPGSEGKRIAEKPEAAELQQTEVTDKETEEETAESDFAEAQADNADEQASESESAQEAALGKMTYNQFLKEAGVSLEEGYRDITFDVEGEEVSISQLLDSAKSLQETNKALLRERHELSEKVAQSAAQMPQQQASPEAQQLWQQAALAQERLNLLLKDEKLANDPKATNEKVNLMLAVQQFAAMAQQKQAEWQGEMQGKLQKVIEERDLQTRARIREWTDPAVQQTEWNAVQELLKSYGIQQVDVHGYAPQWRHLLRDAMLSRGQVKRVQDGAKRTIKKVGKTLGAGARQSMAKPKPDRKAVAKQIRETQDPSERMKLILNTDLG